MNCGDWITLGAVIVALGIGVASILHTQRLQKQERRERLLNEIIDWAMEIARSKLERAFKDSVTVNKNSRNLFIKAQFHEIRISYSNLLAKTAYIGNIAKSFDLDMEKNVENAFVNIIMITKILNELTEVWGEKDEAEIDEYFEVLQEYNSKLENSANKVMDKASKIKVKEL